MELLPAIDLKEGRCVRLLRGDFATVHEVAPDPVAVAESFRSAAMIHVVDLDGAKDGRRRNAELVKKIVEAAAPAKIELGGGLRTMNDLAEADALGVWRFVIGSAALEDPGFVKDAVLRYGSGRVAVGIDAKDGRVRSHGWTGDSGRDELDFFREVASLGVTTVVYTDIAADGALAGPSVARLARLRETLPGIDLIASGGVTTINDVKTLRQLGVSAAIAGKAVYTGDLPLEEALFEARYGALFDRAPLIPGIVQDEETNEVLMLGHLSPESLRLTLRTGRATFFSRTRRQLWVKGETSGNFLDVVSVAADCYHNSLLLRCRPHGPTCHTGRASCFFNEIPLGG
ncbi:MAG: phosphoribosylformimino-5-aminoimidazole carboxamide ribotide isomerase [Oscillospiraceae bacterium]|jgi:phosphoribosylformimino-5-aminoimidazole carboxamide ribotide isomerase|nr:phosphoribosylformimino-5-aminoimidazole carboxamide ribotide isomerase [Oscillospiraceae bacterium]